jgi:hypothetical protein
MIKLHHIFHSHSWQKIAEGRGDYQKGVREHIEVPGALERCECRPGQFAYRFVPRSQTLRPVIAEVGAYA